MADIYQQQRLSGSGVVTFVAGAPGAGGVVSGRGSWLRRRHSVWVEAALVVGLYLVYDSSRGLVGGGRSVAVAHAHEVMGWERDASLNVERGVQHLAGLVPGLSGVFGLGYMALHLGVTVVALVWVYRRGAGRVYAQLRTALLLASVMALAGFALFPTAPPRLAASGIADSVSRAGVNLNSSGLHWLYNPYAAMPSLHVAYAVVVGVSVARWAPRRAWRYLGAAYPVWVSVEVIATGNHFILDVAAGAAVAVAALFVAHLLVTPGTTRKTVPTVAAGRSTRAAREVTAFAASGPVPAARPPRSVPELVGQHRTPVSAGSAGR